MIVICYFDNGDGFSVRYMNLPSAQRDEMDRLQDYVPLENQEAVLTPDSEGLYVVSRHRVWHSWTWLGLYKPFPAHLNGRPGRFFGMGIWLQDVALPGDYVCATLEAAVAKAEAAMMRARMWDTNRFDFLEVGCDDATAPALLSQGQAVEGGLSYGTGGVKVAIRANARLGVAGLAVALDEAQHGRDMHAFSRALIPVNGTLSSDIRTVHKWVDLGVEESWLSRLHPQRSARTLALPPPAREPQPQPRQPEKGATPPGEAEGAMQRRVKFIEDRIRELEQEVAAARRPPYAANAMSAIAILGALGVAGYLVLAPTVSLLFGPVQGPGRPESGWSSPEAVLVPQGPPAGESPPLRPPAPVVVPGADARDTTARVDGAVRALWAVIEGSTAVNPGDKRALNRSLGEFIDALRFSSDPKLKSAGEQLGIAQADQSRAKLRNSN